VALSLSFHLFYATLGFTIQDVTPLLCRFIDRNVRPFTTAAKIKLSLNPIGNKFRISFIFIRPNHCSKGKNPKYVAKTRKRQTIGTTIQTGSLNVPVFKRIVSLSCFCMLYWVRHRRFHSPPRKASARGRYKVAFRRCSLTGSLCVMILLQQYFQSCQGAVDSCLDRPNRNVEPLGHFYYFQFFQVSQCKRFPVLYGKF